MSSHCFRACELRGRLVRGTSAFSNTPPLQFDIKSTRVQNFVHMSATLAKPKTKNMASKECPQNYRLRPRFDSRRTRVRFTCSWMAIRVGPLLCCFVPDPFRNCCGTVLEPFWNRFKNCWRSRMGPARFLHLKHTKKKRIHDIGQPAAARGGGAYGREGGRGSVRERQFYGSFREAPSARRAPHACCTPDAFPKSRPAVSTVRSSLHQRGEGRPTVREGWAMTYVSSWLIFQQGILQFPKSCRPKAPSLDTGLCGKGFSIPSLVLPQFFISSSLVLQEHFGT